jgi:hypothetical protein
MTTRRKRHPVRGAIAGVCLGLGISLILVLFSAWVVKTFTPFAILIGAGLVVGILWGIYGPARVRAGEAPAQGVPPGPPAVQPPVEAAPPPAPAEVTPPAAAEPQPPPTPADPDPPASPPEP